jgi:sigma-B regulation protein RsbU (phosphoserine phosphatase)
MDSNQDPKAGRRTGKPARTPALTRGDAPPEVRPRTYINRSQMHRGTGVRGTRTPPLGYRDNRRRPSPHRLSRELDERVVELQALFDVSRTLNSSLQLKNILDTLLLTPMGKMMIGKGVVLLARGEKRFVIETLKGIPRTHIGQELEIDLAQPTTQFLNELADAAPWAALLAKLGLRLMVPILSNNRCLGLMVYSNKSSEQNYAPNDLEYLNSLANLAATAVENALIFQQLNDVNRRLDKKIQELNTLFEISKELNSTLEGDKIVSVLAYALMGELMVQRCLIYTQENGALDLRVNKGFRGEELEVLREESFRQRLRQISQPVLTSKLVEDDLRANLQGKGVMLILPMLSQNTVRGLVLLGEKITKAEFLDDDVEFSSTLCNAAMISIENARLFQETIEKQKLEEELAIAREIQQRLLPKEAPELGDFELAAINIPTRQVGGDYYDYFPIDENRYLITIADVSGKGVPAALLMTNLQATLHAMMTAEIPFAQIVFRINNFVHRNTTMDKFITAFFAIFDRQNGMITSINAGHNPPYLFHADGGFETLSEGGLLLGMFPNAPYKSESKQLREGDWVVLYTDGVSEAMSVSDEEFGEKRLEEIIRAGRDTSAAGMIEAISNAVKKHTEGAPQSDDITLVVLRCNCKENS